MSLEDELGTRFVCAKCKTTGATVKRISAAGTGISKILDIEHNQFVTASCKNCGFTELYNPEVLEGKRHLGSILDMLFGR
ncbi:MAG TPA: zinc ribbon domain-containing protein [Candidatus Krumholzibacteria bacterium]